jgi:hypothetical protein
MKGWGALLSGYENKASCGGGTHRDTGCVRVRVRSDADSENCHNESSSRIYFNKTFLNVTSSPVIFCMTL